MAAPPLRRRRAASVALLTLALSAPLSADWISLKSGDLIETKGAWREKGKTVVYTSTTGVLSSVRASEVDIPMSVELGKRLAPAKYVDLGVSADPTDPLEAPGRDERAAAEKARLQKFVQDPNAPKVAGTLSASSDSAADRNLGLQAEAAADAEAYRYDAQLCDTFDGSKQGACIMRARIASERRQAEVAAADEAKDEPGEFVETDGGEE